MLLDRLGEVTAAAPPLRPADWPTPTPAADELLIRVAVCGVCHTELDEIEGRTPPPRLPVILGHQVVGRVAACGPSVEGFRKGDRVGVAWIFSTCGTCPACQSGQENLCPHFRATGRDAPGGYAEFMTVSFRFAYALPEGLTDAEAAPLLCAGAIGYRSLRLTNLAEGQRLGLTGFGASAHLVLKLVRQRFPQTPVYVFSRTDRERQFALELGAAWAGDVIAKSPEKLHAIIDTTPAWSPVVAALGNLAPGGRLVINAIRKEPADQAALLKLDYPRDLWLEKEIKSVANVTRRDVVEFLELAATAPLRPEVQLYPLESANQALLDLKEKRIRGAKVLQVE